MSAIPKNQHLAAEVTRRVKGDNDLLTKQELAERLDLNVRTLETLMKKRAIPKIVLGHRTVRFDWPKVKQALVKLTTAEVA